MFTFLNDQTRELVHQLRDRQGEFVQLTDAVAEHLSSLVRHIIVESGVIPPNEGDSPQSEDAQYANLVAVEELMVALFVAQPEIASYLYSLVLPDND